MQSLDEQEAIQTRFVQTLENLQEWMSKQPEDEVVVGDQSSIYLAWIQQENCAFYQTGDRTSTLQTTTLQMKEPFVWTLQNTDESKPIVYDNAKRKLPEAAKTIENIVPKPKKCKRTLRYHSLLCPQQRAIVNNFGEYCKLKFSKSAVCRYKSVIQKSLYHDFFSHATHVDNESVLQRFLMCCDSSCPGSARTALTLFYTFLAEASLI